MSQTGIILDVSQSMRSKIKSGAGERGEPWAQSIFKVIDHLFEYGVSSENRVFAIGVGATCIKKETFDVIGTVQRITEIMQTPATEKHINNILDILEKNGARNIRKWARDVGVIQDILPDYTATIILRKLELNKDFRWKFVHEFLPHNVRDSESTASNVEPGLTRRKSGAFINRRADDCYASFASRIRPATREDIEKVVEKAKSHIISKGQWIRLKYYSVEDYFRVLKEEETRSINFRVRDGSCILKDVGTHSIFSVHDASRIIRGCVGDKELSNKREKELRKSVEPFIYGLTPLYESLEKATKLFEGNTSKNKLLFVLSDGEPTDGRKDDVAKINKITSKLRDAGVKIVCCFITRSTDIHPKRLYDKMSPDWEPGAKFLFSLSSEVRTQDLVARAVLVKRGWTIDIAKNETKLFMQVNHPDNLRY
jgi:DNA-binding transcriptional regulator YhcF (GntR family)